MLSKPGVFMAVAVIMLAPVLSAAQTESAFQHGERKFSLSGSGVSAEIFDNTDRQSLLGIRRFFNLGRVAGKDISYLDGPDGSDRNDVTRMVADYYFDFGSLVPLVGISMGYVQDKDKIDQFVAEPKIGFKYFMDPPTFLYGLLEYQYLFNDGGDLNNLYENGRFFYGIGFGLSFSY